MTGIQCIYVDFDGTLIDSIGNLYDIYCQFLDAYGVKGTPEEFASLNGPTIRECAQILKSKYNLPKTTDEAFDHYMGLIHDQYDRAKPFDDADDFLSQLKGMGMTLILVTSGMKDKTFPIVQRYNFDQYFDDYVFGDEVRHSKPSPQIYLKAIEKSGCLPQHSVAIEDSSNGVESAIMAGLNIYAVNDIPRATKIFKNLSDILKDIKNDIMVG